MVVVVRGPAIRQSARSHSLWGAYIGGTSTGQPCAVHAVLCTLCCARCGVHALLSWQRSLFVIAVTVALSVLLQEFHKGLGGLTHLGGSASWHLQHSARTRLVVPAAVREAKAGGKEEGKDAGEQGG